MSGPRFERVSLGCKACGNAWWDWHPLNVPIETWVAHAQTWHCAKCGADWHHVLFRTTDSPPREQAKAGAWG